jgi:hypothetical protein
MAPVKPVLSTNTNIDQKPVLLVFSRGKIAVLEFGDEVPFSVGAVQGPYLRQAAQLIGDPIGQSAENLDHHDRPNTCGSCLVAGADRKGGDRAGLDQTIYAGRHSRARNTRHRRKGRHGSTRVVAQRAQEVTVKIVHLLFTLQNMICQFA